MVEMDYPRCRTSKKSRVTLKVTFSRVVEAGVWIFFEAAKKKDLFVVVCIKSWVLIIVIIRRTKFECVITK